MGTEVQIPGQTGAFAQVIAAFLERELDPAGLVAALPALQAQRNLFLGRFGAEYLAELSGAELLGLLPLTTSDESLCAWLRQRRTPDFDTGLFGDIGDAGPEEFGLWLDEASGAWLAAGPAGPRQLDEDEAITITLALRDELVAAVGALRPLSALRPEQLDPIAVQRAVAAAAPRLAGSAWLHKYLHLHHPDRVTSAATAAELDAHLRRLGLPPGKRGLYERDVRIIQFWCQLPPLQRLPPRLRYRPGEPPLASRLEAALQQAGLLERDGRPDPLELPVYSLQAMAASLLAGQWGAAAPAAPVEALGTVRVALPIRRRPERLFVARISGESMDDGRSGLCDGAFAVFSLDVGPLARSPIVLVRGSFHEPEEAGYALKRYVEERNGTGAVRRVRLQSLNPNRGSYPDIVLEGELDAIQVVAELIHVLPPAQGPNSRDVSSGAAIERIERRLAQIAARFFAAPAEAARPGDGTAWEAGLVLRDGQLTLVAGPLAGLPGFARELEIAAGPEHLRVLAANLRAQRYAIPVLPSTAEYTWSAPGFEEELAEDLRALRVPGLPGQRATAFRVGAGGVGHLLRGDTLSAGQQYALLVPPVLLNETLTDAVPLGGGWRLYPCELPRPTPEEQRRQLARLGLTVTSASLAVAWALFAPRGYREGRGGERYPCFLPGDEPVLCVDRDDAAGTVVLFVHGPGGVQRRTIAPEERFIALTDLVVGSYFLEIIPEDGAMEIAHLPFAVLPEAPPAPRYEATLLLGQERLTIVGSSAWEGDLTGLGEDLSISLSAPPLWPITARWRGARAIRAGHVHADLHGEVDLAPIMAATRPERQRRRVGDLLLDLGELGQLVLRHRRPADESVLGDALETLLNQRGSLLAQAAGQLDPLRGAWLDPLCEVLGYATRDLRPGDGPVPPAGVGALLLDAPVFRNEGWSLRPAACLIIVPVGSDLRAQGQESPRSYGLRLCQKHGLRRAVLTDGLRWALLSPDLKFLPQWQLDRALHQRNSGELEGFLATFLAEAQP